MLTTRDIYRILELENPDQYAANQFFNHLGVLEKLLGKEAARKEANRRTGRSTRTIIEMISHLSKYNSPVLIVSSHLKAAEYLRKTAVSYVESINIITGLNLDPKMISCSTSGKGFTPSIVFYDHWCFEEKYINV